MTMLIALASGATLMVLAQRRAEAIRLRVERCCGNARPASWDGWRHVLRSAGQGS